MTKLGQLAGIMLGVAFLYYFVSWFYELMLWGVAIMLAYIAYRIIIGLLR